MRHTVPVRSLSGTDSESDADAQAATDLHPNSHCDGHGNANALTYSDGFRNPQRGCS